MQRQAFHLLGERGEELVAQYVQSQGFTVLARNFRCRLGEIDIIALRKECLVFVEVKARRAQPFPISEVVLFSKQQKIIRAARAFLLQNNYEDKIYRFDVATVLFDGAMNGSIDYIEDAFRV